MSNIINSPLQYLGGKWWLVDVIGEYLPADCDTIISPFFGGGALELNLAAQQKQVIGYDICPNLANFWTHFIDNPSSVILSAVDAIERMSNEELIQYKTDMFFSDAPVTYDFERAYHYYLYNRLTFCSMPLTPHVEKYTKRDGVWYKWHTNSQTFSRRIFHNTNFWRHAPKLNVSVSVSDFRETFERHKREFAYVDPPYIDCEHYYNLKKGGFPHEILAEILRERPNWILSYADHPQVRLMYRDYRILPVERLTGRRGQEIIILSHDIREPDRPVQYELF